MLSDAINVLMGKSYVKGLPAVIEVEKGRAKGRASHLPPGPNNIEQACS